VSAVAAASRTPLRERLIFLLGAMTYGLHPEDECDPGAPGGTCADCSQAFTDVDALNAAVTAVQDAATDAKAVAAYDACLLSLAGITSGGDAGTKNEITIPGVGK
jgi:hypothetical protein